MINEEQENYIDSSVDTAMYDKKFFKENKEYCITKTETAFGEHYPYWYSLVILKNYDYYIINNKWYEEINLTKKHQTYINSLVKSNVLVEGFKNEWGIIYNPQNVDFKKLITIKKEKK